MAKPTNVYTYTVGNQQLSFRTSRTATHAIVLHHVNGQYMHLGFAGSAQLAEKALATHRSWVRNTPKGGPTNGWTLCGGDASRYFVVAL
jgi:hypothetical protein